MADATTVNFAAFMWDFEEVGMEHYIKSYPTLGIYAGMGMAVYANDMRGYPTRDNDKFPGGDDFVFTNKKIRLGGAGYHGENEEFNPAKTFQGVKGREDLVESTVSIALTEALAAKTRAGMPYSAYDAVAEEMEGAYESLAFIHDESLQGAKNGIIAELDATTPGAAGLVAGISEASFNDYKLHAGRVVDVRVKATGAFVASGKKRRIASVNPAASPPTVTFETAESESGAGSGDVAWANGQAIYIENSQAGAPPAINGLEHICADSGDLHGISRADNAFFKVINGRRGQTEKTRWSYQMIRQGVSTLKRTSGPIPTRNKVLIFADRFVCDDFEASWLPFNRITPLQKGTLSMGVDYIMFDGMTIFPIDNHTEGAATLVNTMFMRHPSVYPAPRWLNRDGGIFRYPERKAKFEATLWDYSNQVCMQPNRMVRWNNLERQDNV